MAAGRGGPPGEASRKPMEGRIKTNLTRGGGSEGAGGGCFRGAHQRLGSARKDRGLNPAIAEDIKSVRKGISKGTAHQRGSKTVVMKSAHRKLNGNPNWQD